MQLDSHFDAIESILGKWNDPLALLGRDILQAARVMASTRDFTKGVNFKRALEELEEATQARSTASDGGWLVAATDVKRWIKNALEDVRLLLLLELASNPPTDQSELTLVSLSFGLHRADLNMVLSYCRRDIPVDDLRLLCVDSRFERATAFLAPNEALNSTQIQLLNDQFAEPLVGLMHLHKNLVTRFESISKTIHSVRGAIEKATSIGHLVEGIELASRQGSSIIPNGERLVFISQSLSSTLRDVRLSLKSVSEDPRGHYALQYCLTRLRHLTALLSDSCGDLQSMKSLSEEMSGTVRKCLEASEILQMNYSKLLRPVIVCAASTLEKLTLVLASDLPSSPSNAALTNVFLLEILHTSEEVVFTSPTAFLATTGRLISFLDALEIQVTDVESKVLELCSATRTLLDATGSATAALAAAQSNEIQTSEESFADLRRDASLMSAKGLTSPAQLLASVERITKTFQPTAPADAVVASDTLTNLIRHFAATEALVNHHLRSFLSDLAYRNPENDKPVERSMRIYTVIIHAFAKSLYLGEKSIDEIVH
jgi:hypothetical protein